MYSDHIIYFKLHVEIIALHENEIRIEEKEYYFFFLDRSTLIQRCGSADSETA